MACGQSVVSHRENSCIKAESPWWLRSWEALLSAWHGVPFPTQLSPFHCHSTAEALQKHCKSTSLERSRPASLVSFVQAPSQSMVWSVALMLALNFSDVSLRGQLGRNTNADPGLFADVLWPIFRFPDLRRQLHSYKTPTISTVSDTISLSSCFPSATSYRPLSCWPYSPQPSRTHQNNSQKTRKPSLTLNPSRSSLTRSILCLCMQPCTITHQRNSNMACSRRTATL